MLIGIFEEAIMCATTLVTEKIKNDIQDLIKVILLILPYSMFHYIYFELS